MDAQETRFYYSVINYCVNKIITLIADYDHSNINSRQARQTSVEVAVCYGGPKGTSLFFYNSLYFPCVLQLFKETF